MLVLAAGTKNARLAFPDKIHIHVTFVINSFLRYFSSGVCPFVVQKIKNVLFYSFKTVCANCRGFVAVVDSLLLD